MRSPSGISSPAAESRDQLLRFSTGFSTRLSTGIQGLSTGFPLTVIGLCSFSRTPPEVVKRC